MIHIRDLTSSDIGRWVVYQDFGRVQEGRIKGWSKSVIWVVYKCNGEWDRYWAFTGVPTNPADLEFQE